MRISYWSSDVCSSDLSVLQYLTGLPLPGRRLSPKSSCASILQMLAKETAASVPASVQKVALQRCVHADAALPDGCTDLHWREIGRAHVRTTVTNAHIDCSLMQEKKNKKYTT